MYCVSICMFEQILSIIMWCTKTNNYNSDKLKKKKKKRHSPSYNAELNINIWAQNQQFQCRLKTATNVKLQHVNQTVGKLHVTF